MTCVFAWLHLDLYQGSKNVNSFHWTKFDMSCCIQSWRNIPGMVWVHSLNYIIIIKRKKKCVMHTIQRLWDVVLRSHAPFYVLLLFRQYPKLTEWRFSFFPYHSFLSSFSKSHVLLYLSRSHQRIWNRLLFKDVELAFKLSQNFIRCAIFI